MSLSMSVIAWESGGREHHLALPHGPFGFIEASHAITL